MCILEYTKNTYSYIIGTFYRFTQLLTGALFLVCSLLFHQSPTDQ